MKLPTFYKKTIITRGDNTPYLIRYSLFTCKWFALKVHNILVSDDECLHDHPWTFITLLVKGSYVEHSQRAVKDARALPNMSNLYDVATGNKTERIVKHYGPFSLLYRPANFIHRLVIVKPVWSVVITFKKYKPWGFFTPRGWVEWYKYNHLRDGC